MGLIYFLFLVFAVFAACVNGTTNDDTSILISNQAPNHRYLMASNSVDATSEERTPSFSKLVSFVKGRMAGLNFLKRNPSFATTLDRNPAVASQVETLYQKPGLVNSLKNSDDLGNLRNAVLQKQSGLTKTQLEKIGAAAKKSTANTRWIDDEEGLLLAYGILFVMLIIISGVGLKKAYSP
ncbi:hypothetical protein ON010_g19 [Phytophthora cinnamomi]|nr:hypothetical protein ON010_g19 [Phytophthora cinnamomi]